MNGPFVEIIDYTGVGRTNYAAYLLTYTKNTRLQMTPDGWLAWKGKPWEEIEKELEYMANTIPSSWEFVDVTFSMNNVTRACAQQITRTRYTPIDTDIFGSYAMQSQRVTDMSDVSWRTPPNLKATSLYNEVMQATVEDYADLLHLGEDPEDARGLLPMNVHCNLVAKYNLRALAELFRKRNSLRVQDEFGEIVTLMRQEVERIWPWSAVFFVPKDQQAIEIIERVAKTLPKEQMRELAKAADLLKL